MKYSHQHSPIPCLCNYHLPGGSTRWDASAGDFEVINVYDSGNDHSDSPKSYIFCQHLWRNKRKWQYTPRDSHYC